MNIRTWADNWTNLAQIIQSAIQVIGFPLVIYQVSKLRKSMHSTTHSNIYTHYTETLRWFLDKPHLYPYLRENAPLEDCLPTEAIAVRRAEVHSLCELTTTLFEHATLEQDNMPSTSWRECWLPYIQASYERSIEMRRFFEENWRFYVPEYRRLIENDLAPNMHPAWKPAVPAHPDS